MVNRTSLLHRSRVLVACVLGIAFAAQAVAQTSKPQAAPPPAPAKEWSTIGLGGPAVIMVAPGYPQGGSYAGMPAYGPAYGPVNSAGYGPLRNADTGPVPVIIVPQSGVMTPVPRTGGTAYPRH